MVTVDFNLVVSFGKFISDRFHVAGRQNPAQLLA